jgi:hypothetical protein
MTDSPQQILDKKAIVGNGQFIEPFPIIRPIRDAVELRLLEREAALDNHRVIAPTHLVELKGQIAGYIGINSLPMFQGWWHTERMKARNTLIVMSQVENMLRCNGAKVAGFFVVKGSPFNGFVEKVGYDLLDEGRLMVKAL